MHIFHLCINAENFGKKTLKYDTEEEKLVYQYKQNMTKWKEPGLNYGLRTRRSSG